MDTKQLNTLCKLATNAMDSGDFPLALQLARELQTLKPSYDSSSSYNGYLVNVGGLLIDIGNLLEDTRVIQEGLSLLQDNLDTLAKSKKYGPITYYDLGNGYSALFTLRLKQQRSSVYFSDTELDVARKYYNTCLEYQPEDSHFTSQVHVNLGNCFKKLGRVLEALECYEKALALDPNHGMALGNKGIGLYSYARVAGEHQATFLKEAYSLLSLALKKGVDVEAITYFEGFIQEIISQFKANKVNLDTIPRYPGITYKGQPGLEKFLTTFCLQNKLYLNVCNHCQRCDAAVGDTALIKKMVIPMSEKDSTDWPKNDKYLRLSKYLNEVKQDYVTARFLLILSRYTNLDLSFVDKHVRIIDTLDYPLHNIRVGLLKASFNGFYSILDKIAYFLTDYLSLGIHRRAIYFSTVWFDSKGPHKLIHQNILSTNNLSLNALYNLHRDFEDGCHKNLRSIRHSLTHRFVNIRSSQPEDDENMSENSLLEGTLSLGKASRNAILYLLQFVYTEESKKEKQQTGLTLPMYAQEIPDNLKA